MSNTKTEAQRLADRTTPYHGPHAQAMARELLRLDALCDERGTNEARMLMRLTEMQATIDQLRAQLAKAVAEEREACIDIVAMHGGSIEIEAAIRARSNT